MAKLAMRRPLDESDLDDDLGPHPVCGRGKPSATVNGVCRDLQRSSRARSSSSIFRVEAGADLAGEYELIAVEVADEQRAETHASCPADR